MSKTFLLESLILIGSLACYEAGRSETDGLVQQRRTREFYRNPGQVRIS